VPALLKDVIGTQTLGAVYVVGGTNGKAWYYGLHDREADLLVEYHTGVKVPELDDIFVSKLLERLEQTKDFSHYQQYAAEEQRLAELECTSIQEQLREIDRQISGLLASLTLPPDVLDQVARAALARKHADLLLQREALEQKLNTSHYADHVRELLEYHELVQKLAPQWPHLPFSDRKALVNALVDQVLIDPMAPHWLRLVIKWSDPQ
jgi:hypothetical protein